MIEHGPDTIAVSRGMWVVQHTDSQAVEILDNQEFHLRYEPLGRVSG